MLFWRQLEEICDPFVGQFRYRFRQLRAQPEDTINFTTASGSTNTAVLSDIEAFADFTRMLAPPTPAPATPSTEKGRATFASIGCVHCHTPSLKTGVKIASGSSTNPSAALSNQTANLYSDLLVHHMQGPRRRHHPGRRRARRVPDRSPVGRRPACLLPP